MTNKGASSMKFAVALIVCALVVGAGYFLYTTSNSSSGGLNKEAQTPADPGSEGGSSTHLQQATAQEVLNHVKNTPAQVTLLNIWATWCEPCKEEVPHLVQLLAKYKEQGFNLVLVSADHLSERESAQAFLLEHQVPPPSFIKGDQELDFISGLYPEWSGAIPATLIFNAQGEVVDFWQGDASYDEFEARILPHLNSNPTNDQGDSP